MDINGIQQLLPLLLMLIVLSRNRSSDPTVVCVDGKSLKSVSRIGTAYFGVSPSTPLRYIDHAN
ncbi:hypothetical protein QI436_06140 [Staphylococcus aureus]|uniref:hypothetical protein n=1 Tax=Staphylococcus TaxID=1279 RepID=UPI00124AA5B1|nr:MULTISPECIES: hypothetical protein [Staphylococcus]MDI1499263.1 hypothetical protein [Staphylococcus aureus]MDI1513833.1 hypothetical protein [Staphylococcus aureus]MDI1596160.1 hypothetical protein [Staphylococcus aureus]MDI1644861.1 hypothetical protein [Staphylococcus aureus]MDI1655773.1 hypothetical protein [Staphylococcus aureus]